MKRPNYPLISQKKNPELHSLASLPHSSSLGTLDPEQDGTDGQPKASTGEDHDGCAGEQTLSATGAARLQGAGAASAHAARLQGAGEQALSALGAARLQGTGRRARTRALRGYRVRASRARTQARSLRRRGCACPGWCGPRPDLRQRGSCKQVVQRGHGVPCPFEPVM